MKNYKVIYKETRNDRMRLAEMEGENKKEVTETFRKNGLRVVKVLDEKNLQEVAEKDSRIYEEWEEYIAQVVLEII